MAKTWSTQAIWYYNGLFPGSVLERRAGVALNPDPVEVQGREEDVLAEAHAAHGQARIDPNESRTVAIAASVMSRGHRVGDLVQVDP